MKGEYTFMIERRHTSTKRTFSSDASEIEWIASEVLKGTDSKIVSVQYDESDSLAVALKVKIDWYQNSQLCRALRDRQYQIKGKTSTDSPFLKVNFGARA